MDGAADRLVARWLHDRPDHTVRNYRRDIATYLAWLEKQAGTALLTVDADGIRAYSQHLKKQRSRLGEHYAPATVARMLSSVASFYLFMAREGVIKQSPCLYVKRPALDRRKTGTRALKEDEAQAILDAAERAGQKTHVLVGLMLKMGLRSAEARLLSVSRFRDDNGELVLSVDRKGGHRQDLPVPMRLTHAIDGLRDGRTHGYLVCHANGAPWTYRQVYQAVEGAGHAAGVGPVRPHMLRATCITLALDEGISLAWVQDLAGHASPITTRRYDNAAQSLARSRKTLDALEERLGR